MSVILFTTLSGAGYGLLVWTALAALLRQPSQPLLMSLLLALALVSIGLLSSLAHLGKPQRAWRALSQWRTSWLSREGVASLVTYVPALLLAAAMLTGMLSSRIVGAPVVLDSAGAICAFLLIACAIATVVCTAMIYASLKPVPAWRHRLVVPGYLLFALLSGGLVLLATDALLGNTVGAAALMAGMTLALLLALVKWHYWHDIDATPLPFTRGEAVGLPDRNVTLFERPGTEANYVTREMAFVLARKHARRLRRLALVLFAIAPVACLSLAWWLPGQAVWLVLAALATLAGAFVERWLFFAQARHLVTLYY